jgi:hypothetical protein
LANYTKKTTTEATESEREKNKSLKHGRNGNTEKDKNETRITRKKKM